MSNTFRKPFSDHAEQKLQPDSSKSTVEKAKENVTTAADSMLFPPSNLPERLLTYEDRGRG